jgi:hypothetical protein
LKVTVCENTKGEMKSKMAETSVRAKILELTQFSADICSIIIW